jgi:hypothetical protein
MIIDRAIRISIRMDFQTNSKGDIIKYNFTPGTMEVLY